ncbi:hypothetical protein Calag_0406 [Caldisphaera lagunensis DSM 15908]|uniref:Primase X domain-containing protein n=1 Tax=Caldisphaera lagunensis (strain DSM 15908 / JCM 11604 / ANMR 0165 / IC-154) TaxID=1056495 RepID=L0AAX3_CALLD|nr:DNA primase noncatalytic subunit PriX [Caldisphaera lagunensis]AFZ70175.1 hypothetical protein Calag_0406 [Caldisphaera lagunensis DSM 15908]
MVFEDVINNCQRSEIDCQKSIKELLKKYCPNPSDCSISIYRENLVQKFNWIEKIIKNGVPDGRTRLILYVISRYLINVKKLNDEEALNQINEFINNSCKNYNNCSQIYKSWIINVIGKVKNGKWKPWNMDKIRNSDPELYKVLEPIIGKNN